MPSKEISNEDKRDILYMKMLGIGVGMMCTAYLFVFIGAHGLNELIEHKTGLHQISMDYIAWPAGVMGFAIMFVGCILGMSNKP